MLWMWPSSQFLGHQLVHPSNPVSSLETKCCVGLCQRPEVKVHGIRWIFLIHQCSHSVIEGLQVSRCDLLLVKPCQMSLITSLPSTCFEMASRRIFLGTGVRLIGQEFPGPSFIHLKQFDVSLLPGHWGHDCLSAMTFQTGRAA